LQISSGFKKSGGGEEKDNPKEIFYEFFKLFRKQKVLLFLSSAAELFIFAKIIFGDRSPD